MSSLSKDELDLILRSPVSETRKVGFLQGYLNDRQTTATTEMLFDKAHAFQEVAVRPRPEEVAWTGFSALVFKGPFVDLSNWAPLTPWSFAVAMERQLLDRLEQALRDATRSCLGDPVNRDATSVVGAFDHLTKELLQGGFQPSLLALTGDLGTQLVVDLQQRTVGAWQNEVKSALRTTFRILGTYGDIPILDIPESPSPGVYAVDLARFARLKRYGAIPEFKLEEITQDRAQSLLDHDPRLGTKTATTANANADPIEQLKLRVSLSLYETYELTVLRDDAAAGCQLIGPVSEWRPRYQ